MNRASPRLENARKRAKQLLRQHRERYYPVAERLRRALPELRERTDREILDAPLALHRAQLVVARELAFEDWTQLSRSIESMTSTRPTRNDRAEPEAIRIHPQVFVTDMERAVAFYRDQLGFEVGYLYGSPPYYALVSFGPVGLNLRHVDALPFDAAARAREDLLAATLVVRNLKSLFVRLEEAGVTFHQRHREQPWGACDFIVADPDGNLLHFASPPGEA